MARTQAEPPASQPDARAAWLRDQLERANYAYYVLDQPICPTPSTTDCFANCSSSKPIIPIS